MYAWDLCFVIFSRVFCSLSLCSHIFTAAVVVFIFTILRSAALLIVVIRRGAWFTKTMCIKVCELFVGNNLVNFSTSGRVNITLEVEGKISVCHCVLPHAWQHNVIFYFTQCIQLTLPSCQNKNCRSFKFEVSPLGHNSNNRSSCHATNLTNLASAS